MTHRQSLWASMVVLCLSAPPVPADIGPAAVEVFTDPAFPASGAHALRPQGVPIDIFDLSAPRRIEKALSAGLPANEAAALAIARQRLEGQGSGLAAPLQAAYEGHARALSYGLTRYPAIVFDRGRAVVYGTADLGEALRYYRTWKEGTP